MPLRSHPAVPSPFSSLASALHQWAAHQHDARVILIANLAGTSGLVCLDTLPGCGKVLVVASSPQNALSYQVDHVETKRLAR